MFGWTRQTGALGLAETRTGSLCLGAPSAFSGRPRGEEKHPQAAEALRALLAPAHAQQAPTFRTRWASPRLPANAAGRERRQQGWEAAALPSPSPMAKMLGRMGLRLRKGRKAKPPKNVKETVAIFANIKKKPSKRRPHRALNACVSIGKPRCTSVRFPVAV